MEMLDVVNARGEPTGQVIGREAAHLAGVRHRTAHVWIFRRINGRDQVLLQRRSENKESYPGDFDISSAGHIPAGSGYVESALRELGEELGVCANAAQLYDCGLSSRISRRSFRGRLFYDNEISRVYAMEMDADESAFVPQREEVAAVRWFDAEICLRAVRGKRFANCIVPAELSRALNGWRRWCAIGAGRNKNRKRNGGN